MKSTELKIYHATMFVIFSTILVLLVSKALSTNSNSKVYPIERSVIKTSYLKPSDLSKENLSLQKQNYYERLWNEK
jgi:hypothetical protein